jgi:hypothetical protein
MKEIVYGLGGLDETKPNNNIVEIIEHPDPEPTHLDTAVEKLQALGLSEAEINALLGK